MLDAPLSALRTSQQALQTIGNNIANANTPGYHRQEISLVSRRPSLSGGFSIGQGVEVGEIRRLQNVAVEGALLQQSSGQGRVTAELETLRHIESLLTPNTGSLHARLQDFFNQWELLAAEPTESVRAQEVLQTAVSVVDSLNSMSASLRELQKNLEGEIQQAVDEVNELSNDVAALNKEIQLSEASGQTPNDLYDQRDRLIGQLSELIGAELVDAGATKGVSLANGSSFITTRAQTFAVRHDAAGLVLSISGQTEKISITTGRLAGLFNGINSYVQEAQDELDTLAGGLIQAVNTIHASGTGADGTLTSLHGARRIIPTNVPLDQATTDFPIIDGEFVIGVTDSTTGARTLHRIPVDASVDSLEDLGNAINSVNGLNADVDPLSGQLNITADTGFAFDLTGGLPSRPTIDSASGTSVPEISGQYVGTVNDEWTLSVEGSGTVGVDAGLTLNVRDQSGKLIDSVSIGQGYAPGDRLQLPNGVAVQVPFGTVNQGDTFRISLIAESDTSGVLAAVGANDLFTGTRAGNVAVNSQLTRHPEQLSISQSGEAGDGRIAGRIAQVGRQPRLSAGTASFSDFLSQMSAESGIFVRHAENELTGLDQLASHLTAERDSVSGVNSDEELVRMLEFQRMFQSAARFLTSVNETLDEVLSLVR